MLYSPAWAWAGIGLALIIAEVFSGTFVLLFFGLSAFVTAGCVALGLTGLPMEILVFSAGGLLGTLTLRRPILRAFKPEGTYASDDKITLSADVPAGASATVEYQGSPWTAVNEGTETLKAGQTVRIARKQGIRLYLLP